MADLTDRNARHAVLIGGTTGLGKVLAGLLSESGWRVTLVARKPPAAELLSKVGVSFYSADLLDHSSLKVALERLVEEQGSIQSLVFLQRSREKSQNTSEAWNFEFQISLKSTQFIIESLKDQFCSDLGGSIVFVSSMGGSLFADSQPLSYGIAKAGINQMVKHYCAVLGGRQIRVNAVSCFTFLKDESKDYFLQNEKLQEMYQRVVPMRAQVTAKDMAKGIRFFCSEDSAMISGQTLVIDGGLSALGQETVALWASGIKQRNE